MDEINRFFNQVVVKYSVRLRVGKKLSADDTKPDMTPRMLVLTAGRYHMQKCFGRLQHWHILNRKRCDPEQSRLFFPSKNKGKGNC